MKDFPYVHAVNGFPKMNFTGMFYALLYCFENIK